MSAATIQARLRDRHAARGIWRTFELTEYPATCGIIILSHMGRNLGCLTLVERVEFLKEIEEAAYRDPYTEIMCATCLQPDIEEALRARGWTMTHGFVSKRTRNRINTWQKCLNSKEHHVIGENAERIRPPHRAPLRDARGRFVSAIAA